MTFLFLWLPPHLSSVYVTVSYSMASTAGAGAPSSFNHSDLLVTSNSTSPHSHSSGDLGFSYWLNWETSGNEIIFWSCWQHLHLLSKHLLQHRVRCCWVSDCVKPRAARGLSNNPRLNVWKRNKKISLNLHVIKKTLKIKIHNNKVIITI